MAASYWLVVTSPENIATTRSLHFTMQGIKKPRPLSSRDRAASHLTVKG